MPFKREIYVLMRILNNVEVFTPETRRLLTFRSLELYYRTQHVLQHRSQRWESAENDMHILACLRLMNKLHTNDQMCTRNLFERFNELNTDSLFSLGDFFEMEQRVLVGVGGALFPGKDFAATEEDVFLDASRFGAGSMCESLVSEAVTANVRVHYESFDKFSRLLEAVCPFESRFFLHSTEKICAEMREIHRDAMQYCENDPVFARIVQCHCRENFGLPCEFLPRTIQQREKLPETDLSVLRFTMMTGYTDYVMVELVKFRGILESFAQKMAPLSVFTEEDDQYLEDVMDVCKRAVGVVEGMDQFATGSCEDCKDELQQIGEILKVVKDKMRPRVMRAA